MKQTERRMPATIAFGPRTALASWDWVGADTATELCKYFNVVTFGLDGRIPPADVVFFVKRLPSPAKMDSIIRSGSRVCFVPIDLFSSEAQIAGYGQILKRFDLILTHAQSLASCFRAFAPTRFVNHHGKYFLPELSSYKERGYALWVGVMQNLPFLLAYLHQQPLKIEIRILSDIHCDQAVRSAAALTRCMEVPFNFDGHTVNGLPVFPWSPQLQATMLSRARVAIDLKGEDFNQAHKPPTKAQKYICSGLSLAMNRCESTKYFADLGLDIPLPADERWLSRTYYDEVCRVAGDLRPKLTIQAIGAEYKAFADELLAALTQPQG